MLVGGVVACRVNNGVVRAESRQGIHVGVGIIPVQPAVFDPQDPFGPEFSRKASIPSGPGEGSGWGSAGSEWLRMVPRPSLSMLPPSRINPTVSSGPPAENASVAKPSSDPIVQVGGELQYPAVEAEIEEHRLYRPP